MDLEVLSQLFFVFILLLAVLAGYSIHRYNFKYATEGSVALLLGVTLTGLVWFIHWLIYKQPFPSHILRFNDNTFFQVSSRCRTCAGMLQYDRRSIVICLPLC
jgi:hypothetical protein